MSHRMTRVKGLVALILAAALSCSAAAAAKNRLWQTGTWGESQVNRPKFAFRAATPSSGGFAAPPALTEIRTYVIETDDLHLELKETTTSDAPSLDPAFGQQVTFAIEKNTVYIKEAGGREHALHVTRKALKTAAK